MADALAAEAAEQLRIHEEQREAHERKKEAAKQAQINSLQDKLSARLKKKENKLKREQEALEKQKFVAEIRPKIGAPVGLIALAQLEISNLASFWESLEEEAVLKALEIIHDLILNELANFDVYEVKQEVGKFLLASQTVEDILNFSLTVQQDFNNYEWSADLVKLPNCKKLSRLEDSKNSEAKPLFNGPRLQIGIHFGDASAKKESSGRVSYSGIHVIRTEAIGKFAQGGQVLLTSAAWEKVEKSKLSAYSFTVLGVYKLGGFSDGSKVIEVLPECLKERSKYFGSVCAHCNEVIKPNEQFFKALSCVWHVNHFRCFKCNVDLAGSYLEHEGSPYCKSCYLSERAPRCLACQGAIMSAYINALGGYWHTDCFVCQRCSVKPSSRVQIFENGGLPYCGDCFKQILTS